MSAEKSIYDQISVGCEWFYKYDLQQGLQLYECVHSFELGIVYITVLSL